MNIKTIAGKQFIGVNAQFLFCVDGMEKLEDEPYLLNILDIVHDGADANGWDARRIVVQTVDGPVHGFTEKHTRRDKTE